MKKLLFFAALVLGTVSCMKDNSFDANAGGEADVVLSVALPADVTRAINQDSAKGAIGNIDLAQYDIRYILEVFDANNTLAKRVENYEDTATETTFELRLIPGRHYSFVVWADFVAQGSEDALHYNAEDLRNIEIIGAQNAMDESRDAYTGIFRTSADNGGQPFSSSSQISFELKRPFAKLRVVTNDIDEIYSSLVGATIEYTAQTYQQYDALTKVSSELATKTKSVDYTSEAYLYDGEPTAEGEQTLFADYILGTQNGTVQFIMTVEDSVQALPAINFNTAIPVQTNYLTTIYGPILTDYNNVTVTINPAFEEPENVVDVWDGVSISEPAVEADPVTGEPVAVIDSAADLAWFAQYVNGTLASTLSTRGNDVMNFVLTADIDLDNHPWTPIGSADADHGFTGNFDGNNHVIKNLNIVDTNGGYVGLFGVTEGLADSNHNMISENRVANFTLENVNIVSNGDIVAAVIAYPYYTNVENITVKGNVNIKGRDYTAGVLAYTRRCVNVNNIAVEANEGSVVEGRMTVGGIISDIQTNGGLKANYSNFAVSGLTVKGSKMVGGISGIICNQTLNGAAVENVTIVCDDVRKGAISGALGGASVITEAEVNNVAGAERLIGSTYDSGDECTVTINGVVYEYLANGTVKAGDTYYVNSVSALAEVMVKNNVVINIEKGQYIFTKKLSFGKNVTIYGNGATVKNDWSSYAFNNQCSFENVAVYDVNFSNNTIMDMAYAKGEVYFENCVFSHVRGNQSIHFDGQEGAKVAFKNCTMYGRNMLAASLDTVKFDGCKFLESTWNTEQGNKGVGTGWSGVNMWGKYEFTNCQFDSVCHCNCKTTGVVADFTNCTYTNGDAVTMSLINGTAANIEGSAITIK